MLIRLAGEQPLPHAPVADGFDTALERDVEVTMARFGGSLTQVGEGRAVGVFGFPRAHHNDHERGVRAALALQRLERLAILNVPHPHVVRRPQDFS